MPLQLPNLLLLFTTSIFALHHFIVQNGFEILPDSVSIYCCTSLQQQVDSDSTTTATEPLVDAMQIHSHYYEIPSWYNDLFLSPKVYPDRVTVCITYLGQQRYYEMACSLTVYIILKCFVFKKVNRHDLSGSVLHQK